MIKIVLSGFLFIFLVGCGDGGSESLPDEYPDDRVIITPIPDPIEQTPINYSKVCDNINEVLTDFHTEEYCLSNYLSKIGASSAYIRGYTGKNVKIAIIDQGVEIDNKNFLYTNSVNSGTYTIYYSSLYDRIDYDYDEYNYVRDDQIIFIGVKNGGSGYDIAPKITIEGDGYGAEATAILDGSGSVSYILMTDKKWGNNYTYANVIINNSDTNGTGLEVEQVYFGGDLYYRENYAYDNISHGTLIASIALASKNQLSISDTYNNTYQGVAYNADLISVNASIFPAGYFLDMTVANSLKFSLDNNADIVNISLGFVGPGDVFISKEQYFYYQQAMIENKIIVVSSGNSGKDCLSLNSCNKYATLPIKNKDLNNYGGTFIIVGSVDENNTISTFSVKAGITKDYYLVAPGELLPAAYPIDDSSYISGTSAAAPVVSGAFALMKEKFPNKTGKEIAQIFFDTATDLGAPGVDDIYGHGLINIKAAFEYADSLD